jgi:uncharacterized protein
VSNNEKVILIDPTGEYETIASFYCSQEKCISVNLGESHYISYRNLKVDDLNYLLEPAPGTQRPKLLEAVRSLKLLNLCEDDIVSYVDTTSNYKNITKSGKRKAGFLNTYNENFAELSSDNLDFDIKSLAIQVENECIYESNFNDSSRYGSKDERSLGFCSTMISRITGLLNNNIFCNIFDFKNEFSDTKKDMLTELDEFIAGDENIFYVNFSEVPFQYNIREIVSNTIAQNLLDKARNEIFRSKPIVLILDEAHQFLNKKINNEDIENFRLEAFDNIAKEGRKYGVFLCITTQIPRDIPLGTLSQIGTFLVHRLINYRDKEIVSNVLSSSNKEVLQFLPELGPGEIIYSSINLKMPQ